MTREELIRFKEQIESLKSDQEQIDKKVKSLEKKNEFWNKIINLLKGESK